MNKYIGIGAVILLLIGIAAFFLSRNRHISLYTNPTENTQQIQETNSNDLAQGEDPVQTEETIAVSPQTFEHDRDRDGLLDIEEEKLGTSDDAFDTDKDGISDQLEINEWKTDPTKADTDGDGFSDGLEIIQGYNPRGGGRI